MQCCKLSKNLFLNQKPDQEMFLLKIILWYNSPVNEDCKKESRHSKARHCLSPQNESRSTRISPKMNPAQRESPQKWISHKVNPTENESRWTWIRPFLKSVKSEGHHIWIPSKPNPAKFESYLTWIPRERIPLELKPKKLVNIKKNIENIENCCEKKLPSSLNKKL